MLPIHPPPLNGGLDSHIKYEGSFVIYFPRFLSDLCYNLLIKLLPTYNHFSWLNFAFFSHRTRDSLNMILLTFHVFIPALKSHFEMYKS